MSTTGVNGGQGTFFQLGGLPVYVNPLVGTGMVLRFLSGTPQEYVVVDSIATLEWLLELANGRV